jgi:hypothetical protein
MCCLQDSKFHHVHMLCVVCMCGCVGCVIYSLWTCGYYLDIGLLGAGLERVCGSTGASLPPPDPPH